MANRLVIGIIFGVLLSFISVSLFTSWAPILNLDLSLTGFMELISHNFEFNALTLNLEETSALMVQLFNPVLLGWLFIGYVVGAIVKGAKRGLVASTASVVVVLLIWILLVVLSAADLMGLFGGAQLLITIGGIIGAFLSAILGGVIGAAITGPADFI